jgi:hypothetical protein
MILGLVISYMTNRDDPPVDKSLISPVSYFLLPKDSKSNGFTQYNTVTKALHLVTTDSDIDNNYVKS